MIVSGGPRAVPPGTLNELFFRAAEEYDKPDALMYKADGTWRSISHRELVTRVRHVALALRKFGVRAHDRVAILSENRPEWAIADYACLTAELIDVSVYPSLPAEQVRFILADCAAVAIFVSTAVQAEKVGSIRSQLPALARVISFADPPPAGADMSLAELERVGAGLDSTEASAAHKRAALAVRPDDVATFIYTSGTTGEPKGVMLTHDNIWSNVGASRTKVPFAGADLGLSFLPLSHIFERMAGHYLMFSVGCTIAYAESMETVAANMPEVRPTLVLSVPRLYEKMYGRVLDNAAAGGALKQRIFQWSRGVGERWAEEKLAGRTPTGVLGVQYLVAQRLVFSKLKTRTGGRLRYFVSGGAPLSPEINKFFFAAGLVILEGYGLTETSPVIAVNTPSAFRIGTVGRPVEGVEVMIATDGEVLTRGPSVMKGYNNRPDDTRQAIDADGWFHTGDIGELHDGFLSITDRKKDLIVTAGGKKVAPQPIEGAVKESRFVGQVVMLGDRRKFPILLVVPDFDQLERWATAEGIPVTNRTALVARPEVQRKLEEEVRLRLHGLAPFETPKRVVLLAEDFTIDRGELTPTLKVKRRAVEARYRLLIDALYAKADHEGAM
ncbi:MAG: AMP-dependent synthetase/ligase [Gemmatimonadaceae bacterium]